MPRKGARLQMSAEGVEQMGEQAYEAFVSERRARILERVRAACERTGRDASEVTVMAVSKTVGAPEVMAAMRAGYEAFGENRPQELVRKLAGLEAAGVPAPRFDMIGNLQTNKINQVLGRARLIHSVSSEHLAQAVSSRGLRAGTPARVLLECNVSGEATKGGFSPDGLRDAIARVRALEGLSVEGLMTMAPAHDPVAARETFRGLAALAAELREEHGIALPTLSCGMSDDYEIAIEEGSTLVRLGRIVFSPSYRME